MKYEIIDLFGKQKSKGTAEDFFNIKKHSIAENAHKANEFVQCDYVVDQEGVKHIQMFHSRHPEEKTYHRLMIQKPLFGLDIFDDRHMENLSVALLEKHEKE
jgi:hypothetical protein